LELGFIFKQTKLSHKSCATLVSCSFKYIDVIIFLSVKLNVSQLDQLM